MNPSTIEEALFLANRLWSRDLMVETAGLFWIAAELAILYLVLLARFHVEHRPGQPVPRLTPKLRRRAWAWTAGFLLLCLAVGARFYLYPLPDMLEAALRAQASPDDIAALYARWAYGHALIWCAFITIWVILEIAIVYQGRHVYLGLRKALTGLHPVGGLPPNDSRLAGHGGPSALVVLSFAAGALLVLAAGSATARTITVAPEEAAGAFLQSHEAFTALRNAVGLYLRIAGLVWITVEWIAAFYLWRGYLLVRSAAHARSTGSLERRPLS